MASSSFTAVFLLLSIIYSSALLQIYARTEPLEWEFENVGQASDTHSENVGTEHHATQSTPTNHNAVKSSDHGEYDDLTAKYNAYRAAIHRQRLSGSNQGRKGMSDTRYLQNGRFFYDLEHEVNQKQKAAKNTISSNNKLDDKNGDDEFWAEFKEFQKSNQKQYDP